MTDTPLHRVNGLAPWLTAACLLVSTSAIAQQTAPAPTGTVAGATYREIKWDELMPKGWDPAKSFQARGAGIVSDADPRAWKLMKEFRTVLDHAPTVDGLGGAKVRIPGYVVPLETTRGELKEFLLVPYFGACIHTPPPPANQIVFVRAGTPVPGFKSMDAVWVSGTLHTSRFESFAGNGGYTMDGVEVERYVGQPHP